LVLVSFRLIKTKKRPIISMDLFPFIATTIISP